MTDGYYEDDYEDDYYEDDFDDGPRIIYDAPIAPNQRLRSPFSPRVNDVNLGSQTIFLPNADGFPVDESTWNNGARDIVGAKRVLTVRPQDLESKAPGSWVVSLKGVIEENTSQGSSYAQTSGLAARVSIGTGGVSSTFEVDAFRGLFSVPSNDFTVDVGWRQNGGKPLINKRQPYFVPDRTRVEATAHRSLETGESIPTCSYWLLSTVNDGLVQFAITAPPQAVSWCISSQWNIPLGSTILGSPSHVYVTSGAFSTHGTVDALDNSQMVNMIRNQCFRPLSPLGRAIRGEFDTSAWTDPVSCYLLTFRLGV